MKVYAIIAVGLCAVVYAEALSCMTCHGADGFAECDAVGELRQCMPNQNSCETTVRRYKNKLRVTKGCKESMACKNNQMQNVAASGRTTQCNTDQDNSLCTCCCDSNLCNTGAPTCVTHYEEAGPASDCPAPPTTFPHGEIECTNGNKPGAVCEYKCTGEDYAVYPPNVNSNVCLRNGSWANEEPCCARPCPPYFLYDSVYLYHLAGEGGQEIINNLLAQEQDGVVAEDATLSSLAYFSGKVENVIKFNEYDADIDRLLALAKERLLVVNEGPVNVGNAIQYALDNLLTEEAGMRDSRVPKAISIVTNRNAEDDFQAAVAEARRRNVLLYVFAFETFATDGYQLDRDQLLEITGEEDHLFVFDRSFDELTQQHYEDMLKHFCRNPCDHVLHPHA